MGRRDSRGRIFDGNFGIIKSGTAGTNAKFVWGFRESEALKGENKPVDSFIDCNEQDRCSFYHLTVSRLLSLNEDNLAEEFQELVIEGESCDCQQGDVNEFIFNNVSSLGFNGQIELDGEISLEAGERLFNETLNYFIAHHLVDDSDIPAVWIDNNRNIGGNNDEDEFDGILFSGGADKRVLVIENKFSKNVGKDDKNQLIKNMAIVRNALRDEDVYVHGLLLHPWSDEEVNDITEEDLWDTNIPRDSPVFIELLDDLKEGRAVQKGIGLPKNNLEIANEMKKTNFLAELKNCLRSVKDEVEDQLCSDQTSLQD